MWGMSVILSPVQEKLTHLAPVRLLSKSGNLLCAHQACHDPRVGLLRTQWLPVVCSLPLELPIVLSSWQPWLVLLEGRGVKSQNVCSLTLFFQGKRVTGWETRPWHSEVWVSSLRVLQGLLG